MIKKIKPDILFTRGGYVSVPVAIGAKLNKVNYLTHDSDSTPSLANRIIAPWAKYNLVTLNSANYPYPKEKITVTGIPISSNFKPVNYDLKQQYIKEIGLSKKAKLILVIGGGQGAVNINMFISKIANKLLDYQKDLYIVHIVGENNILKMNKKYDNEIKINRERVMVLGFIKDVYRYSGAADLIITRAGATNIAEFAVQAKACILIPSPYLTGGHQLKNAQYLNIKKHP